MNPLTIVLLALNGAASAIELAENFITNQSVLKVLETVDSAIKVAVGLIGGLHAEVDKGIAEGKIKPSDPNLGGLKIKQS
jgi:hypothetical protein